MAAQIFPVAQIFPTVSFGEKIVTKEWNCYGHSCSSNLFLCCQFESYGSFLRLENEPPKDCQIDGCSETHLLVAAQIFPMAQIFLKLKFILGIQDELQE